MEVSHKSVQLCNNFYSEYFVKIDLVLFSRLSGVSAKGAVTLSCALRVNTCLKSLE